MNRSITSVLTAVVLVLTLQPVARAASPEAVDLTERFRGAGVTVDRLTVYELAGIVIILGRTNDKDQAEDASRIAKALGYTRVANLVTVQTDNDGRIKRAAEVELSGRRALDGCELRVSSTRGVVLIDGRVRNVDQRDVALQLLRRIDGVRSVESNVTVF
jgi:osmotically-inducible protein OsmY